MKRRFIVTVEAETAEQIDEVMANRIFVEDEDSPFEYAIDYVPVELEG